MPGRRTTFDDLAPDERLRARAIAEQLMDRGMEAEVALAWAVDKAQRPVH